MLFLPPVALGALLMAGPVRASEGVSTDSTAAHASVAGHAGSGSGRCTVVMQPLPTHPMTGQQDVPAGPGTCLAPVAPSASGAAAAAVASGNQAVVNQSIGVSVRAG